MQPWVVYGLLDRPPQLDGANVALINRNLPVDQPGNTRYAYIVSGAEKGRLVEVDMEFRHDLALYQNPDRYTIFLHELGHFLGAAHSDVSSAVMWYRPYNHATLSGDDITFINVHYGGGGPPPCQGCGCDGRISPCPNFETFIDVFKQTIDSTLYAPNTPGAEYKEMVELNSHEFVEYLKFDEQLFHDFCGFFSRNVSFAESQLTQSPELLTRQQIDELSALLYRLVDGASPELRDGIFKVVALLDQSESKTFKETIEDLLRGTTFPWDDLIQWLLQNYPNPFNPVTTIRFRVTSPSHVLVKVYDVTGREVTTLVDGYYGRGIHQVQFDGSGRASGIYFYRLISSHKIETRKMLLLK